MATITVSEDEERELTQHDTLRLAGLELKLAAVAYANAGPNIDLRHLAADRLDERAEAFTRAKDAYMPTTAVPRSS